MDSARYYLLHSIYLPTNHNRLVALALTCLGYAPFFPLLLLTLVIFPINGHVYSI